MSTAPTRYDVFLSHTSADYYAAAALEQRLARAGVRPWLAASQLIPGRPWQEAMERALAQSATVAVIIGPQGMGPWHNEQMRVAVDDAVQRGKGVVPVLLPGADPERINPFLRRRTWVDFRSGLENEAAFQLLLAGIRGEAPFEAGDLFGLAWARRKDFYRHIPYPPNFVPRPDLLAEVRRALLADTGTLALTSAIKMDALHGMGGIGKSVMARALCDDPEVQAAFPDGILWARVGQTPDLIPRLREWIDALGGIVSETAPTVDRLKAILADLLRERACLLIADDVWKKNHAEAFRVGGPRCRLLLTTRDAALADDLGATVHAVPVMTEAEALELLEAWAKGGLQGAAAELKGKIVRRLGRLPLAIKLAGAQLQRQEAGQWLASFDARKLKARRVEGAHDSLAATFGLSLDDLAPADRRLYVALAIFMEDEPIRVVAIARLWSTLDGRDGDETRELLEDLAARALVERSQVDGDAINIHDLLRDFMAAELGDEGRIAAHRSLLDAYRQTQRGEGWHTALDDGYLYDHLAYHLVQTGGSDELRSLLLDFDWLVVRLVVSGAFSQIADYDTLLRMDGKLQEDLEVALVRGALMLAAHILVKDKTGAQLASQLSGRLLTFESPGIVSLLDQISRWRGKPWLRPLNASLEAPGGVLVSTLSGHEGTILAVAVTEDSRTAISASRDRTLRVWNLEDGNERRTLPAHAGQAIAAAAHADQFKAVAVTSDGRRVVSQDLRDNLLWWDVTAGTRLDAPESLASRHDAVLCQDGHHLFAVSGDELLVWGLDGQEVCRLPSVGTGLRGVAVTPDGTRVVAGFEGRVSVWDVARRERLHSMKVSGNWLWAKCLTVTPDSQQLLVAAGNTVTLWDLETGALLHTFEGHSGLVNGVAVMPGGRHAISASDDSTLKVWDLDARSEPLSWKAHSDDVKAVVITPDGTRAISTSSDRSLKVWNLEHLDQGRSAPEISSVTIAADGLRVICAADDGSLTVWRVADCKLLDSMTGPEGSPLQAHVTQDGTRAVYVLNQQSIEVWDISKQAPLTTHQGEPGSIRELVVASDGQRCVSFASDGSIQVWHLVRGGKPRSLGSEPNRFLPVDRVLDNRRAFSGALFLKPSQIVIVSNTGEVSAANAKTWDFPLWSELLDLPGPAESVEWLAIAPDGRRAVFGIDTGFIVLWDMWAAADDARELARLPGKAHDLIFVRSSRGLHALVEVRELETHRLVTWNLEDGAILGTLCDWTKGRILTSMRDGTRAVSVTSLPRESLEYRHQGFAVKRSNPPNNDLVVWDLGSGQVIAKFTADRPITACAVTEDSRTIVAGDEAGQVHFLRLEEG